MSKHAKMQNKIDFATRASEVSAKRLWRPQGSLASRGLATWIMSRPFLRWRLVAIGAIALLALAAKDTQAIPVQIDLGHTGVVFNGANPETAKIPFNGLNGMPLFGSVSVDFRFTNDEFVRLFTATQPLFDVSIDIQTNGSGFLGFLSGTGHLIDAHGNAIPGFGVTGSASGDNASLSIGLFPLLKDKDGTPNEQLQRPLDFSGVHFDFTFPCNPSVIVTGGEFKLAGNGTFTPFGIGPGVPADIVSDSGSTVGLLALSVAGIVGIRILSRHLALLKSSGRIR
jgi:hypothetical protein